MIQVIGDALLSSVSSFPLQAVVCPRLIPPSVAGWLLFVRISLESRHAIVLRVVILRRSVVPESAWPAADIPTRWCDEKNDRNSIQSTRLSLAAMLTHYGVDSGEVC